MSPRNELRIRAGQYRRAGVRVKVTYHPLTLPASLPRTLTGLFQSDSLKEFWIVTDDGEDYFLLWDQVVSLTTAETAENQ